MRYYPLRRPSQKVLDKIRKKHGLELILLHGSQITGRLHKESDVDIAILPKKDNKGVVDLIKLISDLAKAFRSGRVDIVNLKHADPLLLFGVAQNCHLLSGNKSALVNLKLYAFHRYNDYLPYFELEQKITLKRLNQYVTT